MELINGSLMGSVSVSRCRQTRVLDYLLLEVVTNLTDFIRAFC